MVREETNVAERVGPMVHAHAGERPGFAPGLKSKVLDYRARRVGLWSNKITLFQQFVICASVLLGLAMVAVGTWVTSVEPHDGDLFDGRTIPASWLIVGGSSLVILVALCAIVLQRRLREQARLR
jgi:hypothetical protein